MKFTCHELYLASVRYACKMTFNMLSPCTPAGILWAFFQQRQVIYLQDRSDALAEGIHEVLDPFH